MFKKLIALPLAIREGFRWQKALSLVAKGENSRALFLLEKMVRNGRLYFEVDLLKAQILNEQKRHHECVLLCRSLISKTSDFNKYDTETRRYISAYLKWLDFANSNAVGGNSIVTDKEELTVVVNAVQLKNIADHWKINYPLRIHPNWKEIST